MKGDLRVSDRDRERTLDRLRAAAAEGYLEIGELEARVAAALTARTRAALAAVVADLPRTRADRRIAPPAGRRGARHCAAFVLVNAGLFAAWLAEMGARDPWLLTADNEFPWPVAVMLAWGGATWTAACRRRRPLARGPSGASLSGPARSEPLL